MNICKGIFGSILSVFVVMSGVGSSFAMSSVNTRSINISGDRGGYLMVYALRKMKLGQSRTPVQFTGSCDSACTLYLGLPRHQVCITPGASFNFHLPYGATPSGNRIATNYMLNSYPVWVRSWIRGRGGLTSQLKSMDYTQASRFMPTCKVASSKLPLSLSRHQRAA
jgi:hypothetical protein